jgi:sterol desaturase/sphingolipid hydroxylase (fatty acid hydroxylase superfamily)
MSLAAVPKLSYCRRMKSALALLAWLAASIFVSELLGYFLHRFLHSGKINFLSRSHMKHHLVLYGPLQSQRPSAGYRDATTDNVAIGNIGLEWLIPGGLLLGTSVAVLSALNVSVFHQAVFVSGCLAWSFLMFSYVHDRMHIAGFWMERNIWFRKWFMAARTVHDVHHRALNDEGFMDKNFGIAFFFFDRLFGTLANEPQPFNERGYVAAMSRFGDMLEISPQVQIPAVTECSKPIPHCASVAQ